MCLDALEELAELARKAADVKRAYEEFKNPIESDPNIRPFKSYEVDDDVTIQLTRAEAESVLRARVDTAEAKLKAIGWNPPPKRVTEGQRAAELKEAGHTLPGEVPKPVELEGISAMGAG